jgi:dUTP pyrophosphatase
MAEMLKITIERLHPDAVIPQYAGDGDAGMDVFASETITLMPGETKLVPLGIRVEIPKHPLHVFGYRWECQVRPRSGLSLKTALRVANAPGTIDNNYRGEIKIIVQNTSATNGTVVLKHDRIAQLVFNEVIRPIVTEGKVDIDTDRGTGGFGSTGV